MTRPQLSFEFFPPGDARQQAGFERARDRLAALEPEYMSVTFGAGGSTRDRTREAVLSIVQATGIEAAPHISCMVGSQTEIAELLDDYREQGIRRLVVLRGDRPSGGGPRVFDYAADLVRFIRQRHGTDFHLAVACYPEHHPESSSPARDLEDFRAKVEVGADGAITQYFFSAESYFRFVAEARLNGVDVPIVPGIMPITNYAGLARFSQRCGAEIPLWISKRLAAWEADGDRESLLRFGEEVVSDLCRRLLEGGAPGLHFYTLNRAAPVLAVCSNLGLGAIT